jgi:hypothetical protein
MLPIVERMLDHAEALRNAGRDHVKAMSGQLTLAATHCRPATRCPAR